MASGKTLDQTRPFLADFDRKHYTNPKMMYAALDAMGLEWERTKPVAWPDFGLVRVQWHGPWMEPDADRRARYYHTHWIATERGTHSRGVYDINAMANGTGWCRFENWRDTIVPWILERCEPEEADGEWSITHGLEIVA